MAYTYPPAFYENLNGGAQYPVMRDLIWWMNGTHPTVSNPVPWKVIDCYDNVTRQVPTDGLLSNLPDGNRWKPSDPVPTNISSTAWVVMEPPPSGNEDITERFQVHLRFTGGASSVTFEFYMFWMNNFDTGGSGTSSPALPTPRTQANSFAFGSSADWRWHVSMDEGTIVWMATQTQIGEPQWMYAGETVPLNPASVDPRPFVCNNSWTLAGWAGGFNSSFRGISAVDNSELNVLGSVSLGDVMDYTGSNAQDAFPSNPICNVSFHGNETNHRYSIGRGRNVAALTKAAGTGDLDLRYTAGYTGSDYRFTHTARAWVTDPRVVVLYPPGVALDSHDLVQEDSVPSEMIPDTGGGGDETPPTVTFLHPPPGTQIRRSTAITLQVTDDSGSFSGIQLRVSFPQVRPAHPTETIHSGDTLGKFEPFYQDCTVVAIANGWQFTLSRVDPNPDGTSSGWPGSPTFIVTPVDRSGNAA